LSRKLLVIDPRVINGKTGTIEAAIDTEGTGHWVAVLPDASQSLRRQQERQAVRPASSI